ncbi:hypothetical protein BM527_04535 [Alteromonas sp. Mex14]|nr:hypothetical protein BM527_04535 [Alteromonas sp. Mex14]
MIAEFVQKPDGSNRGQSANLIRYILGVTKHCAQTNDDHEHSGNEELIHYVGSSENICVTDPLYKLINGEVKKIHGSQADVDQIIKAFDDSEALNERPKFPLEHIVLSLQEDEELTIDQWHEAAKIYIEEMGYDNCTWVCALHQDTKVDHLHIALCNISNEPPHNSVNPSNKFRISALARNKIEQKFGLNHTVNPFTDRIQIRNPKLEKNQIRNVIRIAIDEIMEANPTISVPQFQREMWERGIGTFASFKVNKTQIQGLSFTYNDIKVKAGSLGNGYKTKDLFERGLEYQPHRDLDQVEELNELETARAAQFAEMKLEAENFMHSYAQDLNRDPSRYTNYENLSQRERDIRDTMSKFKFNYYAVSIMNREDVEATFEKGETSAFDAFFDAIEADGGANRILGVGIDPKFFKDFGEYLKKLDEQEAQRLQGEIDAAKQRQYRKVMKMIQDLLRGLYAPVKTRKLNFPKRTANMGTLSQRVDHSPVVILSKREMVELLFENKTLKLRSNIEHKVQRYVTLDQNNKVVFKVDRERFKSNYLTKEHINKFDYSMK